MHPVWDLPLPRAGMVIELDDETSVRIRPVRPGDRTILVKGFERLSEHSRYLRFFSARPSLPESLITQLTDVDHEQHLAWAVFDPERESEVADDSGFAIAVARIIVDQNDPTVAEAALTVVDEYQGRGIGRFLIELLVSTAAQYGIVTLRFEVLKQNTGMRAVMNNVGAVGHAIRGDPTVTDYHLAVPPIEDQSFPAGALYELLRRAAD